MISQIQAQREGNPKSQLYLSIHPQNKSREEDSIGVLTIPHDFEKEIGEAEQKNWLKTKITILNIDTIEKSKIPLILQKSDYERIKSNKSEDFTIYKDEILKNIE